MTGTVYCFLCMPICICASRIFCKLFHSTWPDILLISAEHNSVMIFFCRICIFLFNKLLNIQKTFLNHNTVAQLVEALHYKLEGRGFDSQWCYWHNSSSGTLALGSTQPLTNDYQEYFLDGYRQPVHRADNLTIFICLLSQNLVASNSWNTQGP
jgi:hypothetical protein